MNLSEKNRKKKIVKQEKKRKKRKEKRVEELERKTEEKMIQKKKLRRKIKEKLSFTTEKYRKEADRKITESVLELNEYKIHSLQELYPGAYGILEPKEDPERLIQPEAIDFAFIPCISCDRSGRRLGHGGGYYDRYLEKTHCVKAALCREELLVDEIPVEEHDLRMDFVISEKGCYKM